MQEHRLMRKKGENYMKKLVCLLFVLMLLCVTSAFAEGVQLIDAPQPAVEQEPVDMDNIKLGREIPIEGYGVITPLTCEWKDEIKWDRPGYYYDTWQSGAEAEYIVLTMEILNTQYAECNFVQNCEVTGAFGDGYVFGGWHRQHISSVDERLKGNATDSFAIAPLYKGKYAFILTLPNFVKDSTEPLSITVKMNDDIVMTYLVRK